jgi:DNA-binding response OmpR family regulator
MSKILLVEDDIDLNNAYTMILKQDKYVVRSAFNGEEALDALKTFEPDLILLDLIMPVKSGIEFLKEYLVTKKDPPKILVITNLENSSEITEALSIGGYKCVVKSHTTPQGLKKIVKTTLKNKG